MADGQELSVRALGSCRITSPLAPLIGDKRTTQHYVDEDDRVLLDDTLSLVTQRDMPIDALPGFEPAGPRRKIFFDPSKTRVGIVTCGGLCPGLNDVIRGLVFELTSHYGVTRIFGFRNGYQGFIARYGHSVLDLTPELVGTINENGGTILGTSRGQQDPEEIVDCLERMSITILFVIGGDGSLRGALEIARIAGERGDKIAVVGVPKTIDNDVPYIDQSFGFQTAFGKAAESIRAAHVEATSSPNGVGVVKLMGRHSGFLACYASLANSDADVVLIPEVPFAFEGEGGLLNFLHRRVEDRGHAVVVVAEGAGQELFAQEEQGQQSQGSDASGNIKLRDVGPLLNRRVTEYFGAVDMELNLKYIDPSYMIRSVPANPYDSVYCIRLAHAAVHAAMSGRTEMVVGRWRRRFVHVPIPLAISHRSQVDPAGDLWLSVLEATGQPVQFG
ncbi:MULTISPECIES: ATP-dependent 6-phosphofructokinase [unclassified Frankia]|uniref:ATP-dependent 6-phosphofructokinase n=2 Tax=Frankia TaxID=1854 RepID=UPI001EF66D71|nr:MULTISPECIES: ATP-dependent 6-phosphofructokinase [unclassified Frankia]